MVAEATELHFEDEPKIPSFRLVHVKE